MTMQEILPSVNALSHTEKLKLLQFLIQALVDEEIEGVPAVSSVIKTTVTPASKLELREDPVEYQRRIRDEWS